MRYYCTYFDVNYLTRGLALYDSLRAHHHGEFLLWVLCFDETTHRVLAQLNLPGVRPISLSEFEHDDIELTRAKVDRELVEYYWTCTPSLPLYVLENNPDVELITYLDADLYFFSDPGPLFDEFGSGSVLLIEHRFPAEMDYLKDNGIFNVGMLAFRRDEVGLNALHWWRERCIEWCYARREEGKFGDQKYLDDWPTRFQNVVVLQHKGGGLGPWNLSRYQTRSEQMQVTVDAEPLVFYHFHGYKQVSRYVVELAPNTYLISLKQINHLYRPYASALRKAEQRVASLQLEWLSNSVPSRRSRVMEGLLDQHLCLLHPQWLSILLWEFGAMKRRSRARIKLALVAYNDGDVRIAAKHLRGAILRNPLALMNPTLVSILLEPLLGTGCVDRLRNLRRRLISNLH